MMKLFKLVYAFFISQSFLEAMANDNEMSEKNLARLTDALNAPAQAIALVQYCTDGLTETEDLLTRMRDLSIKAQNTSNEDEKRKNSS